MITEPILSWTGLIIGGYLLGSVMFCRVICLVFYGVDICKVSKDKNPGAANAFWYCGKVAGTMGLLLDMLKGFLPVFIAIKFLGYDSFAFILVMIAPVLGHAFSVFYGFSGGKCIATIYGELAALFVTLIAPIFLVVLGGLNILFEFVKKVPGNKRAYIMFSTLGIVSFISMIYFDTISPSIGVASISSLSILKHSPLFTTTKNNHTKRVSPVK